MTSRDEIVGAIATAIERYLATHPDGADSAEGIRGWWLPPGLREQPLNAVVEALRVLERRGLITRTQLEGSGEIFSSTARAKGSMH